MIDWMVEIGSRVERIARRLVKGGILNVNTLIGCCGIFCLGFFYAFG